MVDPCLSYRTWRSQRAVCIRTILPHPIDSLDDLQAAAMTFRPVPIKHGKLVRKWYEMHPDAFRESERRHAREQRGALVVGHEMFWWNWMVLEKDRGLR